MKKDLKNLKEKFHFFWCEVKEIWLKVKNEYKKIFIWTLILFIYSGLKSCSGAADKFENILDKQFSNLLESYKDDNIFYLFFSSFIVFFVIFLYRFSKKTNCVDSINATVMDIISSLFLTIFRVGSICLVYIFILSVYSLDFKDLLDKGVGLFLAFFIVLSAGLILEYCSDEIKLLRQRGEKKFSDDFGIKLMIRLILWCMLTVVLGLYAFN